jgi:xanthine dehydrogenase YagS FAD-binding subunit
MKPFTLERATDAGDAVRRYHAGGEPKVVYAAGGTNLVDLMQLGVMTPDRLVDILDLRATLAGIEVDPSGVTIGALATMSEVASHPDIRTRWPAIASALEGAASQQIRNAATIGGNLLQRTRCTYFRDAASPCNKRMPGAGCSALGGEARDLAVLGTSPHCIANYPGDLAVALVALEASATVRDVDGAERTVAVDALHRGPSDRPDVETTLSPGELITDIHVPERGWDASVYLKVRDRGSYAFALASVAVAIRLEGDRIADVRIALGGLTSRPWRCREAEKGLRGRALDEHAAAACGAICLAGAEADDQRLFKIELGRRAVARALLTAVSLASGSGAGP